MSALPNAQRQVVSLVDLDGLSYSEVADILQIPIGTVMSRLNRARSTLAESIIKRRRQPTQTAMQDERQQAVKLRVVK